MSVHIIFAVFLKTYQLHTESPTVQQNSGNPLARMKDMVRIIFSQGNGIRALIQYMYTTKHLNFAIIFGLVSRTGTKPGMKQLVTSPHTVNVPFIS